MSFFQFWHGITQKFRRMLGWEAVVIQQLPESIVSDLEPEQSEEKVERKKYKPSIAPLRNAIEDDVTDVIERIAMMQFDTLTSSWDKNANEEALSFLYGCDFHYVSELARKMDGGSRFYSDWHDSSDAKDLQDINWPIDIASITETTNEALNFQRMWTVGPAELRGRATLHAPRTALLADGCLAKDGSWFAQVTPIGLINGRWLPLNEGMVRTVTDSRKGPRSTEVIWDKRLREQINHVAMMLQSTALTERYSWHVAFGEPTGPRILLPTNPSGCLALFKTRARREGETRRAALRHWVQHHYRESNEREIAYVCDHLRGTTEFMWRDFNCEIFVSQYDLEKNEFFRDQADQWRAQRKHNRVRVKLKKRKALAS